MLEKIIGNKYIGLGSVVLALSVSGCAGMKAEYFKPRHAHEVYPCDEDNMRHMYCDGEYIYPAVVFEAK